MGIRQFHYSIPMDKVDGGVMKQLWSRWGAATAIGGSLVLGLLAWQRRHNDDLRGEVALITRERHLCDNYCPQHIAHRIASTSPGDRATWAGIYLVWLECDSTRYLDERRECRAAGGTGDKTARSLSLCRLAGAHHGAFSWTLPWAYRGSAWSRCPLWATGCSRYPNRDKMWPGS